MGAWDRWTGHPLTGSSPATTMEDRPHRKTPTDLRLCCATAAVDGESATCRDVCARPLRGGHVVDPKRSKVGESCGCCKARFRGGVFTCGALVSGCCQWARVNFCRSGSVPTAVTWCPVTRARDRAVQAKQYSDRHADNLKEHTAVQHNHCVQPRAHSSIQLVEGSQWRVTKLLNTHQHR